MLVVVCVAAMVHGNPHPLEEDFGALAEGTTVAAKTGVRDWLKKIHNKIRDHHSQGYNHTNGGVLNWVKKKLGFAAKTTTPMTPTTITTTTTIVTAAVATTDYSGDNNRDDSINGTLSSETTSSGDGDDEEDLPSSSSAENGGYESRDKLAEELSPQSGDSKDPLIDPRIGP